MSRAPAKEAAPSGGVLPDPGARLWFMALCASVVVGSAWQIFLSRGGVLPAMLMIVCFVAAWWDAVARRIPNRLTYPLFLASLLVLAVAPDPQSVMGRWLGTVPAEQSLLGLGVFASVGLLCWRVGSMGGGDLKLLSAAAAALGMNQMTWILGLTLAGSALLMLAKWIW
ncbi:MAG TPA: A24 family peptidase, partial [Terriglobales bacterium]|nr:A24 family peptidase [Terriglobales bacterium]